MVQDSNAVPQLSPLKQAYLAIEKMQARLNALEQSQHEAIAIVGMGCRFPGGADTPAAYWELLREGRDAVTEIPAGRWDVPAYYDADSNAPGKMSVKYGAFVEQVDQFDPAFFSISPREATSMDPQQRLLLEVAWEALENAGQAPDQLSGSATGVFLAMTTNDYGQLFLKSGDLSLLDAYYASGIAHSIASGRVSYVLGLQGPSLTVDTACSSSLVSVHLAVQSLRQRECRMALAGGVNLILAPETYIALSKYGMLAPDGRCKTFDAAADGFVRGEGCGVIVMKRLSDAQADGDRILAVIRGSALNQDGPSSGLTAPNGPAQEAVIRAALANAGVEPGQVSYVETHGTGTSLGDPIEVQALAKALRSGELAQQPLIIGAVKTNIGHLEASAGIAGIIKVILMLQHRELTPHLHLKQPNPFIQWDKMPMEIPAELAPWEGVGGQWVAGVSSFGFSGTNAHIVMAAAPQPEEQAAEVERPLQVMALSARDETALRQLAGRYAEHLAQTDAELADVCFTANAGRAHFQQRAAWVVNTKDELHQRLAQFAAGADEAAIRGYAAPGGKPKVAFLFTGQGSQYPGMGRQLYETQPTFRAALDRCAEILTPYLELPLLSVLFDDDSPDSPLHNTTYTQPALFALEYALAQLWRSWGVEPNLVMGHSVGEYVAACIAGVFSLEDGLKLIAARARLMGALPAGGAMVAVFADETRVSSAIAAYPRISIAAVNGPDSIVISGDGNDVQAVTEQLKNQGIKCRPLTVSHAFHSPLMDSILDKFEQVAAEITYAPPRIKLISNVTGQVAGNDVTTPAYWRGHIRSAVQFARSIETVYAQNSRVFLEIGPGTTLLGMGQRCLEDQDEVGAWLPSLNPRKADWVQVADSLAKLYGAGVPVNWRGFDQDYPRRIVTLPTYPFQRSRYWRLPSRVGSRAAGQEILHPLLGYRVRSALKVAQFEMQFTPESFSFLNDHRIYGTALLPATGYLELSLAAALDGLGYSAPVIQDFAIHEGLIVAEDETRTAQLVVTPGDDGRATLEYFSSGDDGVWKLHASGTITEDTTGLPAPVSLEDIQGRCPDVIGYEQHYDHLRQHGLEFGASLWGVVNVWRRDGEALGQIQLPEVAVAEAAAYHIHPALLDACLQTLTWAAPAGDEVYLPLSVDHFRLYGYPALDVWSHVQVHPNTAPGILRGDVCLLDAEGQVIGEVIGLTLKRASVDTLRAFAQARYDDWLYEVAWKRLPRQSHSPSADYLLAPGVLAQQTAAAFQQLAEQHQLHRYFQGLLPELEQLSVSYILQALTNLGWKPRVGERFTAETLVSRLKIIPQQGRLFVRLLDILAEEGLLERSGTEWVVRAAGKIANPQLHWEILAEEYPEYEAELTLANWCGTDLAGVLNGQADPLQLLFPDGGATAERMYRDSPPPHVYNGAVAQAVQAALADLPLERTLRVLEMGGGTGGTTAYVLPHLPADRTEYTFTDIGALFVEKAGEKFSSYPFMQYGRLNIEENPAEQGLAGQQFDLIIAANMIHATADLRQTLAHVRQLLAPGGLFIMVEVTSIQRWIDITFGMTDGWWRFTDGALRSNYPLLSQPEWLALLRDCGFAEAAALPEQGQAFDGQSVLMARNADETTVATSQTKGHWLILGDGGGAGRQLAEQLQTSGAQVTLAMAGDGYAAVAPDQYTLDPASPEDFQRVLDAVGSPDQVVYLWGLDAILPDDALTENLERAERRVLEGALNLVQALVTTGRESRLTLVTCRAQSVSREPLWPLQAALWGLGKTIALEHPELACRRIDLDYPSADENLLGELLSNDTEDQIVFRRGARYGARLVRQSALTSPLPPQPWQLGVSQRGTLENLRFEPVERRLPGPGEVEIRVCATGLNFKDVLNTLGMYPGDPGPLGGECSGRVAAVGDGVTGLQVGDAVMALAPGCFSSHVIAPAELTVPKPASMSFEAAAGFIIPFVTAYYALHHVGHIRKGDKVLIHAAAGGVGMAAVQLAQHVGAEIFATAGNPQKRQFLADLGIPHVMDSRSLEFADTIMQITDGRGVDVVLNSLAGDSIAKSLSVVAENGRFLEIGKSGLLTPDEVTALGRNIAYTIIDWSDDARQNPALIRSILDALVAACEAGDLLPLPEEVFPIEEAVSAFTHMAHARHIGKVIISQGASVPWDGTLYPDATYLVVGGLRGLGLLVAQWLVEHGARHLALMGRNAPGETALETLHTLEAAGAEIIIFQEDVAQEAGVARMLDAIQSQLPPLRGIIHSAGLLDDGALIHQNWSRFATVLGPKVNGAWYLHDRTRDLPLDFFVLFSSAASLLGSSGQGNHAAANAFEDALAHHRQSLGLPGLSINWGAWSEVGAAADRKVDEAVEQRGIGVISPAAGLEILDQLMRGSAAQVGVMPMDWPQFLRQFVGKEQPFLKAYLTATSSPAMKATAKKATAPDVPATPAILSQLADAKPARQRALLIGFVQEHARKILGAESAGMVDTQMPLSELGLDSLMAVELRNLLGSGLALKRSLPATLVFDYPTIEAVADYLLRDVLALTGSDADEAPETVKPPTSGQMAESISELSDEEVDRLLKERMKKRK
ncbi:MAG: SDR family NAD(P)-dependent oxidoreductase [Anaerolineaceae bacterium]|nr:SDR family NAD(P)-dependent oxidoreductase [Anaerolineaceae bacterium]